MNLAIVAVLIGNLTVTSYRSVRNQTDNTPFHTSTGAHVQPGGVAVSRDLLCGACRKLHKRCAHPEYQKKIHYGDWLYVEGYGFRFVNDCMSNTSTIRYKGKRLRRVITNQIDIWVNSYQEEKTVDIKKLNVYKIQIGEKKCQHLKEYLSIVVFVKKKLLISKKRIQLLVKNVITQRS